MMEKNKSDRVLQMNFLIKRDTVKVESARKIYCILVYRKYNVKY